MQLSFSVCCIFSYNLQIQVFHFRGTVPMALVTILHFSVSALAHPCLSYLPITCLSLSWYLLYFHFSLLYLCLCVCSQAVVPPCSPPSVWIVCLLLLLTTIAIQTSALPHSFPSALETLILRLPAPLLTSLLLHSTHHLCNFPITFPLLPILHQLILHTQVVVQTCTTTTPS